MRQRGFTLVELLVALMVMAMLAVLSWRGVDGMARTTAATQARANDLVALQNSLAQWGADLDAMIDLFPRSTSDQTSSSVAAIAIASAPAKAGLSTASNPGGDGQAVSIDWNGQVLRLVRAANTDQASGLRVVAWTRRQDGGQGLWLRWQSDLLINQSDLQAAWLQAGIWAQNPDAIARSREVPLVALMDWQIYYYRNDAWSNPLSSAEAANAGPDGVRLVLTLPPGGALSGVITRDWIRPTVAGNKS